MAEIAAVTDDNFATEVEGHDGLVLVDFWAEWCGPCRKLTPIVQELADEYGDKLKVVKLDVEGNRSVAGKYAIMSIPALLLFSDGELKDKKVGVQPKSALTSWIDEHQD